MKKPLTVAQCACRGALIGGTTLAITGLVGGIVLVFAWSVPVPPIVTFEGGCITGALLGALIGAACAYKMPRFIFLALLGAVVVMGLGALLLKTPLTMMNVQRLVMLALIIGINAACMGRQPANSKP